MESMEEILKGKKLVLVDFFAVWCGPCKGMMPIVEELEKEFQGKADIVKIDIDQHRKLAVKHRIQTVPTFMIFKDGEMVWRKAGVMQKSTLAKHLSEYID